MKHIRHLVLGALATAGIALSQGPQAAQVAAAPRVELRGRVESVQILRGQGTPCLMVKSGEGTVRVILGSMRYLVERGFNPKAGEEAHVKGFRVGEDVYAATVTLLPQGTTLQFRDEQGRPLWIGGRFGRGGPGRGGQGRGRGGW